MREQQAVEDIGRKCSDDVASAIIRNCQILCTLFEPGSSEIGNAVFSIVVHAEQTAMDLVHSTVERMGGRLSRGLLYLVIRRAESGMPFSEALRMAEEDERRLG